MGAKLSLLAPSAPTIAISSYIDILTSVQYIEVINNSRFLKTIKAIDKRTGCLIIVKILIKPSNTTSINLQDVTELIVKESSLLASNKRLSNVLPWSQVIETDRAGYLIRQHCKTNLYDRLSIRSFLQPIEKVFIMYQMLRTIDELHSLQIRHGDLRLENFLVTSWNWLLLTDFASYTKPVFLPEDNPNQFLFYFDSSDRRVCYLAPERFTRNDQKQNFKDDGKYNGKNLITNAMDYFGLGCVIAELFMDGEPIFTLSSLFKYIRGEYQPDLTGIPNTYVKEIITKLISIDPINRPSCKSLLNEYKGKLFPKFFDDFLYDFMSELNDNDKFAVLLGNDNYSISDLKLEYVYSRFGEIATNLNYDYKDTPNDSKQNMLPLALSLPGMPENYTIKSTEEIDFTFLGSESTLIIINLVYSLIKTLKRPSSKLKACELILALSERINDECILDRSLPYLCSLLDEYLEQASLNNFNSPSIAGDILPLSGGSGSGDFGASPRVASFALKSITTLLMSCLSITPLNTLIFPEYIIPKLLALLNSQLVNREEKVYINISIANCLPYLATVAKRLWLFSNNFKINTLGEYESRLPSEDSKNKVPDSFNVSKDQLDFEFENLSLMLLTDSSSLVKVNLVSNILPLCKYFGIEKTNDIILPHLITFLNDSDIRLRLAFLDCVLELGPYVGVLSFEQYLLPLLIQTLCDLELFVILKVLKIFNEFIKDKLINPQIEFKSLNVYKEIISNAIFLILFPNEWIRQSVLNIILSICDNITNADKYCFLFPLIKSYLSYDIATFDWNTLYPCLTKPLTKPIFELAVTWSLNATNKSLFWKQSTQLEHGNNNTNNQVVYNNGMGKSLYAQSDIGVTNFSGKHFTVPLSAEDKQWLFKLKSIGLDHKDLWKVFMMRDFIFRFSKGKSNSSKIQNGEIELINHANIIPRNVFFELCYKSEPITQSNSLEIKFELSNGNSENVDRRGSNSLVLPNFTRVQASVQTVQANVFAELEPTHNGGYLNNKHHHHTLFARESNSSHKVFSVNNQQVITSNVRFSYTGNNPFILNYIQSIDFSPNFDNFPEFGSHIKPKRLPKTAANESSGSLKGVCVSQINTNTKGGIDSINCIALCEGSDFFVTGSESGYLKIWDTSKLDKNFISKKASISLNLGASITFLKFLPKRLSFAVSTTDGTIRIYKVEVARNKAHKIIKYNRCQLVREYKLFNTNENGDSEGHFIDFDFTINSSVAFLIGITSTSKIIALDIIKMEKVYSLQNQLIFGIPTTFIVNQKDGWLLLGTNKGYLCLWDLRYELNIKTWEVHTGNSDHIGKHFPIKKLVAIQRQKENVLKSSQQPIIEQQTNKSGQGNFNGFAMIGGTGDADISIWDIPTFTCTQVLSSYNPNPRVKLYKLEEYSTSVENGFKNLLIDINREDSILENQHDQKYMTYLCAQGKNLYSATSDKKMNVWNLETPELSIALNYDVNEVNFTSSYVNQGLTMINERIPELPLGVTKNTKKRGIIHQDLITGIVVARNPFETVISVDRNGYIYIYQ